MKMIVKEEENEGLMALLGKRITLYCINYNYTGELVGVNDDCVKLKDAGIIYETGKHSEPNWKDYERLGDDWYVSKQAIESFGIWKQQ